MQQGEACPSSSRLLYSPSLPTPLPSLSLEMRDGGGTLPPTAPYCYLAHNARWKGQSATTPYCSLVHNMQQRDCHPHTRPLSCVSSNGGLFHAHYPLPCSKCKSEGLSYPHPPCVSSFKQRGTRSCPPQPPPHVKHRLEPTPNLCLVF